jgi:hypothetical protein
VAQHGLPALEPCLDKQSSLDGVFMRNRAYLVCELDVAPKAFAYAAALYCDCDRHSFALPTTDPSGADIGRQSLYIVSWVEGLNVRNEISLVVP